MVKANAYGHGAETVTQTLASIGCKTLFTATTDEAVSVRNAIGDKGAIFVFNGGSRREGRSCRPRQEHEKSRLCFTCYRSRVRQHRFCGPVVRRNVSQSCQKYIRSFSGSGSRLPKWYTLSPGTTFFSRSRSSTR